MENNKIEIPDVQTYDEQDFRQITLNIQYKDKEASRIYHLHKCSKVEYKQTTADEETIKTESQNHPETIYFCNSTNNSETLQVYSKHQEVSPTYPVPSDDDKTLYFVTEESEL